MVVTDIKDLLRDHGLKITPVRLRVLEILLKSDTALSHGDITEQLADESIDKVTLYRTLNAFNEKGIVHKVATEDRNWLYAILVSGEKHVEPEYSHAHFICDDCEKIFCLPMNLSSTDQDLTLRNGFLIKQQEVRLHGLCPSCQ